MADDPRPDDDATRIYRPYGSPPPDADEPDPFAPDPPASGEPSADPFAPSRPAPTSKDPFAPDADPFAPEPSTVPADDPFAPRPSGSPDPFAPPPSKPSALENKSGGDATDLFGPPIDFGSGPSSDGPPADDPFAAPPEAADLVSGGDPFAPPPTAAPTPDPDPFRAPETGDDPFAPRPGGSPDPFAPSPPSTPDPFSAGPPPEAKAPPKPEPKDDPFELGAADPFAPAPKAPAPQPRDREDPFAARPSTETSDPFASLKSAGGGGGGGYDDSSFHGTPYAGGDEMELPESFGTERTLAGAFTPVFSLVLQIRAAQRLGDGQALRQRIERLLAESARTARSYNVPEEDIEEATFCLVAFLDEAILATDWPGHDAWSSQPLQLTHYDRYDAGERFFDRLKRLLDEGATRTGVLEVYYLCLALGFKGRYAIHGREVLRRLVEDLHGRLERAYGAPGALSPRGRSREVPAEAEKDGLPTWALWVGAAVLVALLYLGLSFSLSGAANDTADDLRALTAASAE
ncbi:type IVB secretion system protein IcmH/DotU [Rubrivirga marina]|uniref:Type IV / VI secretion system DotU domain-containing protein n=1 Tax=Rubrivirga marina TaxID=1196024 RepID=A0A271IWJ8_9BACT|nr:type IVB secretion system protein IcmH/DotU [Rubrivirga marina]PAP75308.1 hypothetical protein BSZ37_02045 [Rubrivirga marina]